MGSEQRRKKNRRGPARLERYLRTELRAVKRTNITYIYTRAIFSGKCEQNATNIMFVDLVSVYIFEYRVYQLVRARVISAVVLFYE